MKKRLALLPAAVAIALGLGLTGQNAEASISQELTHKAHKIEDIARELKTEFRKHYAHLGAFRHLMSDLSEICAQAEHIDTLAHNPRGSLRHLQADVKKLDQLTHHLHEVLDAAERSASGHVHGRTGHVHKLLTVLDNTIHRLSFTIAGIGGPGCATPARGRHGPAASKVHVVKTHAAGRFGNNHARHAHRR